MSIVCPNCQADLPDDAVFCDQCGASLTAAPAAAASAPVAFGAPAGETLCPQCSQPTIPGEAFCDHCGASLTQPEVLVTALPEPQPEPVAATEPVEAPEMEAAAPPPAAAPGAGVMAQCPACGAENLPGSKFCSNCGIHMQEAPVAEPAAAAEVAPEPAAEVVPGAEAAEMPAPAAAVEPPAPTGRRRFVVRDTGAEIPLPSAEGEYIIGREDPVSGVFPEIDMNPHEGEQFGVSRRHAKLIVDAGLTFIEDLDSTNFTFVDRKKLAPRSPSALSNGDEVRLGKLVMTYLE